MFNLSVNSYRRGLRNDVLVNPKLFILEKVNLAPHTKGWSNLVKLDQTWSNLVKRVKNLYYLVRVVTLGLESFGFRLFKTSQLGTFIETYLPCSLSIRRLRVKNGKTCP